MLGGTFLLIAGGWPLLYLRLTSAFRAEAGEAIAPPPLPEPKVPPEGAGIPPMPWVKAYVPNCGKAMCPLTELWALAVLDLPTSHPRESSGLELLGKQDGMLGMGEEPGTHCEPGVFEEHCPMHTNGMTLVPSTHYRTRVSQAHRNLRLGPRWYLLYTQGLVCTPILTSLLTGRSAVPVAEHWQECH